MLQRCKRNRGRFASHEWRDDGKSVICDRCGHVKSEGLDYVVQKRFQGLLARSIFAEAPHLDRLNASKRYLIGDMASA